MSQSGTGGFDLLVEISEVELNTQLAIAPLPGYPQPNQKLPVSVTVGGQSGTFTTFIGPPSIDLDPPGPRDVALTVPFRDAVVDGLSLNPVTGLAGLIRAVDGVTLVDGTGAPAPFDPNVPPAPGATKQAILNFGDGVIVTVTFDANSTAALAGRVSATGLAAALEPLFAAFLLFFVRRVSLGPPIPLGAGGLPGGLAPLDFDVGKVNDTSALDRDALIFGIQTRATSGGSISSITATTLPPGARAGIIFSNDLVLRSIVCPALATALRVGTGAGSPFDDPCTLNRRVPFPGAPGAFLERLTARVAGSIILIEGAVSTSGTGWNASASFAMVITVGLTPGAVPTLSIRASTPAIDTTINLEWWVYVAVAGGALVAGGLGAASIAALYLTIMDGIADLLADTLVSAITPTVLGALPIPLFTPGGITIPLGPVARGLTLGSVVLDDLTIYGTPEYPSETELPIAAGDCFADPGCAFDLDTGQPHGTGQSMPFGVDLTWDRSAGGTLLLSAVGAAALGLGLTHPYHSVTHTQLRGLSYVPGLQVSAEMIPQRSAGSGDPVSELVVAVRTGGGRYAKCALWRQQDILHLRYVTYDEPTASLGITGTWFVIGRAQASAIADHVAWRGTFQADARNFVLPVDYQWCFDGHVLTEGVGSVQSATGGVVRFGTEGPELWLESSTGETLEGELCVSALDAWQRELFTCVPLSQPGTLYTLPNVRVSPTVLQVPVQTVHTPGSQQARAVVERSVTLDPELTLMARRVLEGLQSSAEPSDPI